MGADKKPADRVREKLNAVRVSMLMRFGEKGSKAIFVSAVVLISLALVFLLGFLCIRIQAIEVRGNVTMFNEGEIIDAAEIDEGDGLFWKSTWAIKRNIAKNLPASADVKVRKTLLGKVIIELNLVEVDYFCKYGELYYALDSDLNVLDSNKSKSKYSAYGAVYVKLPEIREPVVGKKIVFYYTVEETDTEGETVYEVEERAKYDYVTEYLKALKSSGYHSEANGVILEEKFDVRLIYAKKFNVKFGDSRDLDVKFRVLYEILAIGDMKYSDKATIDLSDPSRATSRTDLTLDFSEFVDE